MRETDYMALAANRGFPIIRAGNEPVISIFFASPMKWWPKLSLLLFSLQPLLGQGEVVATPREQKGDDALAAGLWEVAELHFKECLAESASTTPEARARLAIHLAESLIRGGNPAEAVELLEQSWISENPAAPFWKAQALASRGNLAAASVLLSKLLSDPAAPHRIEAAFTLKNLQLTLGQPQSALDTLGALIPEASPSTRAKIRLEQVEILIDLDRATEARSLLSAVDSVAASDQPIAAFLTAQLLLKEGRFAEARVGFQELINHPQGQSLERYHLAAIGLADAIMAEGNPQEASSLLIGFLDDHPTSPFLDAIFQRLVQGVPSKPKANDSTLEGIARWITPPTIPASGLIAASSTANASAAAAWPVTRISSDLTELRVFSLFTRALVVHRFATQEANAECKQLLRRLLLENPDHALAPRALYQLARWALEEGSAEQAFSMLAALRDSTKLLDLKGEATFLEARATCLNGDPTKAIQLFDAAALELTGANARTARLMSAIARLRSGDFSGTSLIQHQNAATDDELEADIELERALAIPTPNSARPLLEEFLRRFPSHPRVAEAKLAAVEAALNSPNPDLGFAKSQLDSLLENGESPSAATAPRIALNRLKIADLSNDAKATATIAESIITQYPSDPAAAEAALTLGRSLFQSGSYNAARLVLEKLAASDTHAANAQAAWLLAARAAALGGTPQSKEEALILFDKAIGTSGPVSSIAILEKAKHLINLYRLGDASTFLSKWMMTLPETDPLQLPAGLLLGDALYAQGSSNPASLVEALAVYDKLLKQAVNQTALLNRLQYLRGLTLEQLPDELDPAKKRNKQALQAYHSVLEVTTRPTEWYYFESCGFRAITLLENAQRWREAVNVANQIASFKGPRAEEASTRASQLQLKHMIWED
jgi:outer membrane protein assembly factor BamD (BamD/ComL family)